MGACSTSLLSKHTLLVRMATDPDLTKADVAAGAYLLEQFNAEKGYAWPAEKTIAKAIRQSERTVRRSIGRLIECGYFTATKSTGRGNTNTYVPVFENRTSVSGETGHSCPENRTFESKKPDTDVRPYQLETPVKESEERIPSLRSESAREAEPANGSLFGDDDQPKTKSTRRKQKATDADLETYQPDQRMIEWARAACRGVDPLAPSVLERWRNHHLSKGTIIRDLNASYRTWLLREPEFASYRPKTGAFVPKSDRPSPHLEAIARLCARASRAAAAQQSAAASPALIGPPIIDQEGNNAGGQ